MSISLQKIISNSIRVKKLQEKLSFISLPIFCLPKRMKMFRHAFSLATPDLSLDNGQFLSLLL